MPENTVTVLETTFTAPYTAQLQRPHMTAVRHAGKRARPLNCSAEEKSHGGKTRQRENKKERQLVIVAVVVSAVVGGVGVGVGVVGVVGSVDAEKETGWP